MPAYAACGISIHALLAESDFACWYIKEMTANISIHALLAESDQNAREQAITAEQFLSTLSLRRATAPWPTRLASRAYFYPRSPCGERQKSRKFWAMHPVFLSTLSLRRATAKVHKTVGHFCAYETNFMGIASSC